MGLKSIVPRKSTTAAAPAAAAPADKPVRRLGSKSATQPADNNDQNDTSGGTSVEQPNKANSTTAAVDTDPAQPKKRQGRPPGSGKARAPVAEGDFDRAGAKARLKEIEAAAKQSRKDEEAELAEVRRTHADARRQLQSEHAQISTRLSKDLF